MRYNAGIFQTCNGTAWSTASNIELSNLNADYWGNGIPSIVIDGTTAAANAANGAGIIFNGSVNPFLLGTSDQTGATDVANFYVHGGNALSNNNAGIVTTEGGTAHGTGTGGTLYFNSGPSTYGTSGGITFVIASGGSAQGAFSFFKSGVASVVGQPWVATGVDGQGYWDTEWHINASLLGGNATMITSGSQTTFLETTNGSLTMTPRSGSAAAGTVCATTNATTTPTTSTSVCGAGNEGIGISFTNPIAGAYYDVCIDFMDYCVASSGGKCQDAFALNETPTNAQTISTQGDNIQGYVHGGMTIATGTGETVGTPIHMCQTFTWANTGIRAIRLMYKSTITDTVTTHLIVADGGPIGSTDRLVYFTVRRIL